MELSDFNKAELYTIADKFGADVEHGQGIKKQHLVDVLEGDGITVELVFDNIEEYKNRYNPEPVEAPQNVIKTSDVNVAPQVKKEDVVVAKPFESDNKKYLIKMTRANPHFEIVGCTFTEQHPYALVDSDRAEYLLTRVEGFRQATPSELEDYYN